MKELCWSILAVAAVAILMSGCGARVQAVIPTYTDPAQAITVKNGEEFVIQLGYEIICCGEPMKTDKAPAESLK
jgi:hypothetical protein